MAKPESPDEITRQDSILKLEALPLVISKAALHYKQRLASSLQPPILDDLTTQRVANVLNIVFVILITYNLLGFINMLFVRLPETPQSAWVMAINSTIYGIAYYFLHRKRIKLASWLMLGSVYITALLFALLFDSVNLAAVFFFVVAIAIAGMVLKPRDAAITVVFVLVTLTILQMSAFALRLTMAQTIITYDALVIEGIILILASRSLAQSYTELGNRTAELTSLQGAINEGAIIAITDEHGCIEFANDNFVQISKYSRGELIGQDHRLINSGRHSKEYIRNLWETITRGDIWRGEICNQAKDGSLFWMDTIISPILGERGTPKRYLVVRFDITKRKRIEETIRQNEARLAEAAEIAQLGYWEADVPTQMFTFTDQLYALFRTTAEEQGGYQMSVGQYIQKFVHPDDAYMVSAEVQKAIETGDPNFAGQVEHRIIRADGSVGFIIVRFRMIKDAQVRTVKTVGISQDITERKQVENTLAAREQEFRSLAESSPDFIIRYDAEHHIRYINNKLLHRLMLVDPNEVLGKHPIEVWPDGRFVAIDEAAERAMKSGSLVTIEIFTPNETGKMTFNEIYVVPELDVKGDIIGTIAFGRDITERKRIEETIRQNEARLAEAADIAQLGYWELDFRTQMFTFTDQFYTLLCTTTEEQGGYQMSTTQYTQQFVHPGDAYMVDAEMQKVIETTDPDFSGQVEHRIIRGDGSEGFLLVRYRVIKDEQSQLVKIVGMNQDITERKRAESERERLLTEVQQSQELLRSIIDATPDWIFIKDQEHRFRLANQGFADALHLVPEDFIGKNDLELGFPEELVKGDPKKGIRGFWADDQLVMDSGEMKVYSDDPATIDGEVHTFHTIKTPLMDTDGQVWGVLAFARDITDLKQAEAKVRESQQLLESFLENFPDAAWAKDLEGRVLIANRYLVEDVYGTTPDQVIGKTAHELFPDKELADFLWASELRLIETGETLSVEEPIPQADGKTHDKIATKFPIYDTEGNIGGLGGILIDITERKRVAVRLQKQLHRVQSLRNIDLSILGTTDLRLTLKTVLEETVSHLRVDAATVHLFNADTLMLEPIVSIGECQRDLTQIAIRLGEGIIGNAALKRQTLTTTNADIAGTPNFPQTAAILENTQAIYATPLTAKGKLMGVLSAISNASTEVDQDWMDYFETLAGQTAMAVDSSKSFEDLQRSHFDLALAYDTTIEGWSRALDLRDHETEGHTQRVTEMTLGLARAAGIAEDELVHVRRGALLHDIGKIGIPDEILHKQDALTEAEWNIMRQHPTYAYEMLLPIAYLHPAMDIPYCHHEKWDGTGYPRGLQGEQIPLAARLFTVVDVWDALRSDRPYRKGWPEEDVLEHIYSLAGTHFDPKAVELFFQLMKTDL